MLSLHPSDVSELSHKPLMILSCLSSIEIFNFSTNNHHFIWRGSPCFYFNSTKKPARRSVNAIMLRIPVANWSSYDYTVHDPCRWCQESCFIVTLPSIICPFRIQLESVTSRAFRVMAVLPTICYQVILTVKPIFQ
jgi:hypothetical protein